MQRFGLYIDDFGIGHSTLAQLRDVPFKELKVDRGFVQGGHHNQIIRPMLEGSIAIARGLGMASIAEGVETEDDWLLLRELGCESAQATSSAGRWRRSACRPGRPTGRPGASAWSASEN